MKLAVAAAAMCLAFATGCVNAKMTPLQAEYISAVPTCSGKDDCELKWARATKWLQENSYWKLRNVTETLMTTEGPLETTHAAFTITKYPMGNGTYQIEFQAGCGNIFGCVPSINELHASFNHFVATGG